MKNRTAYLLLISMLASFAASCGEAAPAADTTAADTTEAEVTTSYLDTLPSTTYAGKTFTILGPYHASRTTFAAEEETGEPVNDALWKRDREVEERLEIELACILSNDINSVSQNSILAGDDEYQAIIGTMAQTQKGLAQKTLCLNLNDLPHMTPDAVWWSPEVARSLTVDGKLLFTTSPLTLQFYFGQQVTAYNTRLAKEYKVSGIEDAVLGGSWTLDKLEGMLKDTYRDLDSSGDISGGDQFGMVYESSIGTDAFFIGAAQKYCENDGGELTVALDSESTLNALERIRKLVLNKELVRDTKTGGDPTDYEDNIFMEGRAMFITVSISHIIAKFREMEDDYVIIPVPKLDEKQESYLSYANPWCLGGISVPVTVSDYDMTGHVLETMAYLSWEYVRPAQYDQTLKHKVSRDGSDNTMEILDLVFEGTYYDLGGIFDFGGSRTVVGNYIKGTSDSYMSDYEAVRSKIGASIENFMACLPE